MAIMLKSLLVFIVAWIAMVWPGAWTALLVLLGLSAMFLGMALERHFAERETAASARKTATTA